MTAPAPQPGAERRHREALARGVLLVPRCASCHALHFPPRAMCPHCAGTAFEDFAPSGLGTVHSVTVIRRKADAGGDASVCLVDLDEGLRLLSRVDGMPPADVKIGQRVAARVRADGTAAPLLVFVAAEATA